MTGINSELLINLPKAGRIIRSQRKTLALEITHDAILVVRAPYRTSDETIAEMIREKQGWIRRKIEGMKGRQLPYIHKYMEGEIFLFLGGSYPLTLTDDGRTSIERLDRLYVPRSCIAGIRETLDRWYMHEALLIYRERCAYFSMVTGLNPVSVRVTGARQRWGSCTSEGRINFTWRLVQAPLEIVDYVVVHELVHLKHHNHSKRFWDKVLEIMPDYPRRRAWLKENEYLLRV